MDKLAQLIGSIRWLGPNMAHMTDGNETLAVTEYYCAFCDAIHGNPADGEGPCIHKDALALAMMGADLDDDYADLMDTYRCALGVA